MHALTASRIMIPADLKSHPVFLCIDDTMVSKFGKKLVKDRDRISLPCSPGWVPDVAEEGVRADPAIKAGDYYTGYRQVLTNIIHNLCHPRKKFTESISRHC